MSSSTHRPPSSLPRLPLELLFAVVDWLTERDLSALHRTSRPLYETLYVLLYRRNVDESGSSLLPGLARGGHLNPIETMLRLGANAAVEDSSGTAIFYAVASKNEMLVQLLLDAGDCGINIRNRVHERSPLGLAAERGDKKLVALLLTAKDISVNGEKCDWQPLHLAAAKCHAEVVRLLLGSGADPEAKTPRWETALYMAARCGHIPTIRVLIDNGKSVLNESCSRGTPFLAAVKSNNVKAVSLLLACWDYPPEKRRALEEALKYASSNNLKRMSTFLSTNLRGMDRKLRKRKG
jgi:ankyrin repeat protein